MAVLTGADPIDRALDHIARLTELPPPTDHIDQLIAAATIAGLWEIVAEHALATGDPQLLVVAARERQHAELVLRTLSPP